jgi:hypothetical protein
MCSITAWFNLRIRYCLETDDGGPAASVIDQIGAR